MPFIEELIDMRVDNADIRFSGWEHNIAQIRGYRIRGFSWFKTEITGNISEVLSSCEEDIRSILLADGDRDDSDRLWHHDVFKLRDEVFGPKQFRDAANGRPVSFLRAVQCLMLAEAVARKSDRIKQPLVVYEKLRIEPAVSYIFGFTRQILDQIQTAKPEFLGHLAVVTAQPAKAIFYDMAVGMLVTHKLAVRVRQAIMNESSWNFELGDVGSRPPGAGNRVPYRKKCSQLENWDVDDDQVETNRLALEHRNIKIGIGRVQNIA